MTQDVSKGLVDEECLVAMLESLGNDTLPTGIVALATGIVLLLAMMGGCSQCSGLDRNEEDLEDDKVTYL